MTNQKQYQHTQDTIDSKSPPKDILSLVLSFIGFGRSTPQDDDSNRSLYSSSFSSSSTKVASTSASSTSTASSSSCHYTYDDADQSTLYYTEEMSMSSLPPTPTSSNDNNKCIEESVVFVPSATTSEHQSLYDTWAFQDWLQRLPKLALFHLVSSTAMQDHMVAYHLLEYQYMDDINNNNSMTPTPITTDPSLIEQQHHPLPCDNITHTLVKEIEWIQTHSRAILHQLDHLRPNEQFAKAQDITDQLLSMIRLCGQQFFYGNQWGDSWLTVMALVLVAKECLDDTPAEIRQCLFYRAKMGRLLVLEMNAVLKNYKAYRGRSHPCYYQQQEDRTTTPQQYVADYFFQRGWRGALETVCNHLARLDDGWKFRTEYQQAVTLAANIPLD